MKVTLAQADDMTDVLCSYAQRASEAGLFVSRSSELSLRGLHLTNISNKTFWGFQAFIKHGFTM